MIEIIKHGDLKPKFKQTQCRVITCPNCYCVFSCSNNDIQVSMGNVLPTEYIYCPECGSLINLGPQGYGK